MFDKNNDGFIDLVELRKVTTLMGATLSARDLNDFMREADKVHLLLIVKIQK